ncbi:DUF2946 family protein [Limobrevibacterium gyesilva]|uniref:DUF2946 domain-containing protein n=1 Tax=Limobrevibacterium gyesilva TaxID=2991712 RepID=A0AA41YPE6_9PROT|nr:DUF2946 family protein [Limobrevibacterium gyesilva]MCW3475813.1 hypothetical protein [Limobrevibacterium gyesilva]
MRRFRPVLARVLAALLLLQWGGGPAHCLAMAAVQAYPHTELCLAPGSSLGDPGPRDRTHQASDHTCPACHALGHAVVPPQTTTVPQRIAWSVTLPPAPQPALGPAAPRAPPLQPRAPPALS